ncbi:hypothetical protein HDV02_002382 [Globomyces sp. JEL0801]|nr:hypothetical protein HDV02_002382 [Globomyces sp. JEL0801]
MVSGVLNIVTIMMSNQIGVIISKFLLGVVQSGIYLPNSPDTCWFLNTADKVLAVARGQDGYDAEIPIASTNTNGNSKKTEVFTFRYIHFLDGIKDFRIWLISFTYLVVSTGLDYIALVMPDISANIALQCNGNCSPAETNLYHVPLVVFFVAALPYAIGMVISYLISTHSDKTGERALHIACALVISTFGLFMLGLIDNVSFHTNIVRYIIGVLPAVIGLMSAIPSLLAYGMDRAVGDTHKVTLASVIVCLGQSFGLTLATASFSAQSFFGSCLSLSMFLIFGIGAVLAIRHLNHAEEQDMWGKGPGLRRLMNDADEAKAWDGDIEMDDFEFQKTNRVKEADEWE